MIGEQYPTVKGKHLFAAIICLGLITIIGFAVWSKAGHVVAQAEGQDAHLTFFVKEFRDDPFPWNILHGSNGLFHYQCEIHDQRGELSAFSYFRNDSDGRVENVEARWESPNQVTATFDSDIVVECRFGVSSKANWSLK